MRRIAAFLTPVMISGLLAGCAEQEQGKIRPLPPPLLASRPPTPPSAPVKRLPPPEGKPQRSVRSSPRYDSAGWTPPGGITSRWSVIVVHHSGNAIDSPQSMHQWHLQRGWENGLGYDFVIGNGVGYPDGQVFVGPRWKRQITGAHCGTKTGGWYFGAWRPKNYFNEHGIGICLIGNLDHARPTEKQLEALHDLTQFLCSECGIPPSRVYGHGHITHKTECPGRNMSLSLIRQTVSSVSASAR